MTKNEENIFNTAKYLGQLLKEDERLKELEKAKNEYNSDPEVVRLMAEYQASQQALASIYGDEKSKDTYDVINKRISEIYDKIIGSEAYKKYEEAQATVNTLMETVNSAIQSEVTGESTCTHDCSTCGGCH